MDDREHFEAIFSTVRAIPSGHVMSYGQVGQETGCTARTVGWAMANVPDDVPWQRVVGADGYLRIGKRSVALQEVQRRLLEREGVQFLETGCVDMTRHQVQQTKNALPLSLFHTESDPAGAGKTHDHL